VTGGDEKTGEKGYNQGGEIPGGGKRSCGPYEGVQKWASSLRREESDIGGGNPGGSITN